MKPIIIVTNSTAQYEMIAEKLGLDSQMSIEEEVLKVEDECNSNLCFEHNVFLKSFIAENPSFDCNIVYSTALKKHDVITQEDVFNSLDIYPESILIPHQVRDALKMLIVKQEALMRNLVIALLENDLKLKVQITFEKDGNLKMEIV